MEIILLVIVLMVLFIPNNNEPGLFFKWIIKREIKQANKDREDLALKHKGDNEFIAQMINNAIDKHSDACDPPGNYVYPSDIDAFSTYIFHASCHDCITPHTKSISGCYNCIYFNLWDGEDKKTTNLYKEVE